MAIRLTAKSLDDLDPGFCNWFVGLVDGEGSLQLKHQLKHPDRREAGVFSYQIREVSGVPCLNWLIKLISGLSP